MKNSISQSVICRADFARLSPTNAARALERVGYNSPDGQQLLLLSQQLESAISRSSTCVLGGPSFMEIEDGALGLIGVVRKGDWLFDAAMVRDEATVLEELRRLVSGFRTAPLEKDLKGYGGVARRALSAAVSVITGPPGTGKTTAIVDVVRELTGSGNNKTVMVMASSNSAAVRLTQLGVHAVTVHAGLGFNPYRNEFVKNRLDVDVVVLDEAGLLDVGTYAALISAVRTGSQLILVGDKEQLGSVRGGDVFFDICSLTGLVNVIELQDSHRFGGEIGELLNSVRAGVPYPFDGRMSTHFIGSPLVREESYQKFIKVLLRLNESGVNIMSDLQILSPVYDGLLGVTEMNDLVATALFGREDRGYTVGQRVVFNEDLGVYKRGDSGVVESVSDRGYIRIRSLDGSRLATVRESNKFDLGYCRTFHAAQGHEWEHGVVCLRKKDLSWLGSRGIVTALSRFKSSVTIYSDCEPWELFRVVDAPRLTLISTMGLR